jgi:hypothetical protein
MTDEKKGQTEDTLRGPEEDEVEPHRQNEDEDDDEVEAHRWGTHGPEDPGMSR